MNFASDNWAGAAPQIARALAEGAGGFAAAYGTADIDRAVEARIGEIFEREVAVLAVGTGSAANSLALALAMKPGGIALAHEGAHVIEDECGGPELAMGGGRIEAVGGPLGKIDASLLEAKAARFDPPFVHHGRAVALTLTQATECGTVYTVDEISRLAAMARRIGLTVHMDGARFANALVSLDATPAQMTWKAGIDVLSFGGTKNGCWCAEALVLFDTGKREEAEYLRKRAGHLFSKNRFVSLQFAAYLESDLWLDMARHANAMAQRARDAIRSSNGARLAWGSQANEVFFVASRATETKLRQAGASFHEWHTPGWIEAAPGRDEAIFRIVTSFATTADEVDRFGALIGG